MPIYLDHAATTPLDPTVYTLLQTNLKKNFGNPSSLHSLGRAAKVALNQARRKVAGVLHAQAAEIFFTSGGTEGDNLVLFGLLRPGDHAITSAIEHPAILQAAAALTKRGVRFTYLKPRPNGCLDQQKVLAALNKQTRLISIMLANNEIGTLQPIAEIGQALQKRRQKKLATPFFHTDAVQGAGLLSLDVQELGVDCLTLSAHKFYGPKGVGILFRRQGVPLEPLIWGGGQEQGLRSGTENLPSIVAAAGALALAEKKRCREFQRLQKLRDHLEQDILRVIPQVRVNGAAAPRLPGHLNLAFFGIEGESLILHLDALGICAATGSACSSRSLAPSHVLQALGLPEQELHGSLRFSLGRDTTAQDLRFVLQSLKKVVVRLRQISAVRK